MLVIHICELFHWDYEQYMRQPVWFLEMIHKKMEIDGKKSQQEAIKAKMKSK